MEIPSPPLSHSSLSDTNFNSSSSEHEKESSADSDANTLINSSDMEYLNPLAFMGIDLSSDQTSWSLDPPISLGDPAMNLGKQHWSHDVSMSGTCAPDDTFDNMAFMPFNSNDDDGFQYDFSFGQGMLSLPSPPNTNSSSDPPSPFQAMPLQSFETTEAILDPSALTSEAMQLPSAPASGTTTPAPTQARGTKRPHGNANPRTKTSHTTIERRYRTNLNARIVGLRAAVPALRVLDKNIPPPEGVVDVVDDRGYVDGVKAAKKNSKATILGKATEYITVLKRREARLRTELRGIKDLLISIMPEGEAFLMQWELDHYAVFGGEQSDELPPDDTMEEDDEDEDDGPAKEEAVQKPAKKAKTKTSEPKVEAKKPASTATIILGPNGEPVKRKRGRPRKNPLPSPTAEGTTDLSNLAPLLAAQGEMQFKVEPQEARPAVVTQVVTPQVQPSRFLLATFAFFSFFGNNLKSAPVNSSGTTHEGTVLNTLPLHAKVASHASGWINDDVVKIIHLVTSVLLFVSILAPYLPGPLKKSRFVTMLTVSNSNVGPEPAAVKTKSLEEATKVGDVKVLKELLGLDSVPKLVKDYANYLTGKKHSSEVELAWRKLSRVLVTEGEELSLLPSLRVYYALASVSGTLVERALLARGVFPSKANALWTQAQQSDDELQAFAFRDSLDQAASSISRLGDERKTATQSIEAILVREQIFSSMKDEAQTIFTERVLGSSVEEREKEKPAFSSGAYRHAVKHNRKTLGTEFDELFSAIDGLRTSSDSSELIGTESSDDQTRSIRELVLATQLFLRLFPGHTPARGSSDMPLSPPPSPTHIRNRETARRKHELRCLLARDTFDGGCVEQAREVVVDLLTQS